MGLWISSGKSAENPDEKQSRLSRLRILGLMKSELLYLQEWDSIEQFAQELKKYIRYYNNDRIKLSLNGKSPVQYRALFQSKRAS